MCEHWNFLLMSSSIWMNTEKHRLRGVCACVCVAWHICCMWNNSKCVHMVMDLLCACLLLHACKCSYSVFNCFIILSIAQKELCVLLCHFFLYVKACMHERCVSLYPKTYQQKRLPGMPEVSFLCLNQPLKCQSTGGSFSTTHLITENITAEGLSRQHTVTHTSTGSC